MNKKMKLNSNPFERTQPVSNDFLNIPLLGMVRASNPLEPAGNYNLTDLIANFNDMDREFITLEVLDDAMSKSGILRGDYLTVKLHSHPRDGDIIVVQLGEKFYIRKFYHQNNLIRLETDNEYPSSLIIENKTPGFQVIGIVQSVLRQF